MDLHVLREIRYDTAENDARRGERRDHIGEREVVEVKAEHVGETGGVEASLMIVHLGQLRGGLVNLKKLRLTRRNGVTVGGVRLD